MQQGLHRYIINFQGVDGIEKSSQGVLVNIAGSAILCRYYGLDKLVDGLADFAL